ncbi:MAG: LPXTG cell wall anchor domain-containing protein [Chitinophagaceae bacterium]
MINRNIYTTIVFVLPVFFSFFAAAQGKTTVRVTIDRSKILIGEPILLRLEADIPETQPISFFQIDSIPHFEFLSVEKIDTSNTSNGTVLSQLYHITSFDSGHWVIPSFALYGKIETDTLPVDVGYSPYDPNQPYHDIKDIIEVTPEEEKKKKPEWWWYAIGGALLLLLILFLVLRKKKKPVPVVAAPPPDAYKIATEALARLRTEKNEPKQYYSRLVDIFRMYVLERKGIHSLQQTTDDLVVQLRGLNLPKEQFEQLAQSLRISDFVKFAKYVPSNEDDSSSFETIKRSIDSIEQMK